MSDEQTTPSLEHQPRVIGFVSGRPDEQEKQKSNIENYYPINPIGYYSDKGVIFLSWDEINEDLKRGDLKLDDVIIIDDLKRLAGDWGVLANRLLPITKKEVYVDTVNKEQRKLLNWGKRLRKLEPYIQQKNWNRVLENLKILAKKIFPDTESQENLKKKQKK